VIDSLAPHEDVVRGKDGRWYSLRIRPYVTLDSKIDGASIVLLDIEAIRRTLTPPAPKGDGEAGASAPG
jgi:two-component system CheB/CheR fusion protein